MVALESSAQKKKLVKRTFAPPPSIPCVIKKPANFKGILYQFPSNIRKLIDSELQLNKNRFSFIELITDDKYVKLFIHSCDSKVDSTWEVIGDWIYNTNRYYQYQSKFIPIILDYDTLFSDYGWGITGDVPYIKYEKREWWEDYAKIIETEYL